MLAVDVDVIRLRETDRGDKTKSTTKKLKEKKSRKAEREKHS